jgi:hypothetical protein
MDVKYVNVMKGVSHRINSSNIRKYNDARKLDNLRLSLHLQMLQPFASV